MRATSAILKKSNINVTCMSLISLVFITKICYRSRNLLVTLIGSTGSYHPPLLLWFFSPVLLLSLPAAAAVHLPK